MTNDAPYQPLRTGGKTVVMSMRIPVGLRDQMIEDMETMGDYNNLNQWIQQAIREFILKRAEQRKKVSERDRRFSRVARGQTIEARAEPPGGDGMTALIDCITSVVYMYYY